MFKHESGDLNAGYLRYLLSKVLVKNDTINNVHVIYLLSSIPEYPWQYPAWMQESLSEWWWQADFLNFVPQLIRKIFSAGTTQFYRFACTVVAQVHISLLARLEFCRGNCLKRGRLDSLQIWGRGLGKKRGGGGGCFWVGGVDTPMHTINFSSIPFDYLVVMSSGKCKGRYFHICIIDSMIGTITADRTSG